MHSNDSKPLSPSYSTLIRFAIPVMLAGIATPLMGMVDTAVLGRLGDPAVIAAAGVGGTIFTIVYWCFSFLRFTTTGLVAQAVGRQDREEVLLAGLRPMTAAIVGGVGLWALQWPIGWVAMRLLTPPAEVQPLALQYFHARIWSAPFTLLGYAQFAWLMGQGHARAVMLLQVALNALNAVLAMILVLVLHWGIAGAGWATVCSEAAICLLTTLLMLRLAPWASWRKVFGRLAGREPWRRLFAANFDLLIRTLLLAGSFALITERGAQMGTLVLAANQILLQAFMLFANLLDGFATAAEVFGARAFGAGSRSALTNIVKRSAWLSLGWGSIMTLGLALIGSSYLAGMTSNLPLREEAMRAWPWIAAMPLVCVWAFLWDGVFMGATRTHTLRNTMIASVSIYVPLLYLFSARWGNHGIWAGLMCLMAARSILLTLAWPALWNSVGAARTLAAQAHQQS
jgi:MATE family multidrug resistance protein